MPLDTSLSMQLVEEWMSTNACDRRVRKPGSVPVVRGVFERPCGSHVSASKPPTHPITPASTARAPSQCGRRRRIGIRLGQRRQRIYTRHCCFSLRLPLSLSLSTKKNYDRRTAMVELEAKTYNGHKVVGVVLRSKAKTIHFLRHAEGPKNSLPSLNTKK